MDDILLAAEQKIIDLIEGYAVVFHSWDDSEPYSKEPFILFRFPSSGGESNPLIQEFDLLMVLVSPVTRRRQSSADVAAIQKRFREAGVITPVRKFYPIGNAFGPMAVGTSGS